VSDLLVSQAFAFTRSLCRYRAVWLHDPRGWFETDDLPKRTDVSISTDCLSHTEEKQTHGRGGCTS
jgi:hypothetical protein